MACPLSAEHVRVVRLTLCDPVRRIEDLGCTSLRLKLRERRGPETCSAGGAEAVRGHHGVAAIEARHLGRGCRQRGERSCDELDLLLEPGLIGRLVSKVLLPLLLLALPLPLLLRRMHIEVSLLALLR